jgi:hypothetical protein
MRQPIMEKYFEKLFESMRLPTQGLDQARYSWRLPADLTFTTTI